MYLVAGPVFDLKEGIGPHAAVKARWRMVYFRVRIHKSSALVALFGENSVHTVFAEYSMAPEPERPKNTLNLA
jgi:hypothetical protein